MLLELVATGRIADLVLLCLAVEALMLTAYRLWCGGGPTAGDMLALILPGAFLALALRAALLDADAIWVILNLAAAFLAHLADLRRRWRRPVT